jgi:putative hydrolases of HD superfamily
MDLLMNKFNLNKTSNILHFLHMAERLKDEMRHSWTSTGRQESVAEHSWRLALMVILCEPYLEVKINLQRALIMALVHDLVEMKTGDKPLFYYTTDELKAEKVREENQAMDEIRDFLGDETGDLFHEIWLEFEKNETPEAKLVLALDKMEAQIQHNEADFSTWLEYDVKNVNTYLNPYCGFDSFMQLLKEEVQAESKKKIQYEGSLLGNESQILEMNSEAKT